MMRQFVLKVDPAVPIIIKLEVHMGTHVWRCAVLAWMLFEIKERRVYCVRKNMLNSMTLAAALSVSPCLIDQAVRRPQAGHADQSAPDRELGGHVHGRCQAAVQRADLPTALPSCSSC